MSISASEIDKQNILNSSEIKELNIEDLFVNKRHTVGNFISSQNIDNLAPRPKPRHISETEAASGFLNTLTQKGRKVYK